MAVEDNGVLGNLPRSRPGTRSEKRSAAGSPPKPRPRPPARPAPKRRTAPPAASAPQTGDPVGEAVRTAAKVAGAGLKLADGLTRGVLKRLPKP